MENKQRTPSEREGGEKEEEEEDGEEGREGAHDSKCRPRDLSLLLSLCRW